MTKETAISKKRNIPNSCTMYTVVSQRGVYYGKEIGGASYPQTFHIFKGDAQKYANEVNEKWPYVDVTVVEVTITPITK